MLNAGMTATICLLAGCFHGHVNLTTSPGVRLNSHHSLLPHGLLTGSCLVPTPLPSQPCLASSSSSFFKWGVLWTCTANAQLSYIWVSYCMLQLCHQWLPQEITIFHQTVGSWSQEQFQRERERDGYIDMFSNHPIPGTDPGIQILSIIGASG